MGNQLGDGQDMGAPDAQQVLASWSATLRTRLAPIDQHAQARAGLAADIARYVLEGAPLGVLAEAASLACVAHSLHLTDFHKTKPRATLAAVYEHFDALPMDVALRWARLLEAAQRCGQVQCFLLYGGGAQWPEALMMHASGEALDRWAADPQVKFLTASRLEAMLLAAGLAPSALLTAAFAPPPGVYVGARPALVTTLSDYPAYLHKHLDAVRPLLLDADIANRANRLGLLARAEPATLVSLGPQLCELATAGSEQVRAAAGRLALGCGVALVPALTSFATQATPVRRKYAMRLLWNIAQGAGDAGLQDQLRSLAGADKAASVQALLQEWDHQHGGASAAEDYQYSVPVIDWGTGFNADVERALDVLWEAINRQVAKNNKESREQHAKAIANGHNWGPWTELKAFTGEELARLRHYLASPEPLPEKAEEWDVAYLVNHEINRFAAQPGVTPVALFKVTTFFARPNGRNAPDYLLVEAFNAMQRATGTPSLLELQQMVASAGVTPGQLLDSYCSTWGGLGRDWPAEALLPFFAHHVDLLVERLAASAHPYNFDRAQLYRAIALLPWPPASAVDALFELAFGGVKVERAPAQAALAAYPGKQERIIAALASGKADVRSVAAQWLAQLDCKAALPGLETALAKEKNDMAKGAMLDALQKFGQPVEKYFDRAALLKEAQKALAKGLPKELEWFPWPVMPEVRWADSGAPVATDVLQFLLAQAVKQKSAEPNAVLRKFCSMFDAGDRERWGQFVLEAWIGEDTRPISADEAQQRAHAHAQSMHQSMQQWPQYWVNDPNLGRSPEEIAAALLPQLLRLPAGSAIASKGVLACAAACAAQRAAATAGRYLKEYYGTRAAHGKALIAMLAWVEHPGAIQLVLSVGNRFRTKSFQEEATRQVQALAERKGWTVAELADRTIPSGGFDEAGELELRFGQRSFTARLLPDFKVELFSADGRKLASLPEPRMDDDAGMAKAAKQSFSAARKEIKSIVTMQTERLYEALCIERDWQFDDWQRYLNEHPVVRRLIQRLVWVQLDAGGAVAASFRPLDDGTLSDCDDNPVSLAPDARVRLAHDSILAPAQVAAWQRHLADYDIAPLFQQLGKGSYSLPDAGSKETSVTDFEGHLIDTFALRTRATKLGYARAATEDGGWFYAYEKRFATLGLVARIAFTGNPLPEEKRTAALLTLAFSSADGQRGACELGKVPKVLLSECYNDLRLIAADGPGFDPDWEQKSEY